METVLRDVRFGLRMLLKNPGFTAVSIITMALGLGANTALFSVVNGVMLKSLPFKDPDRLVFALETNTKFPPPGISASTLNYRDWKEQSKSFEAMSARQSFTHEFPGGIALAVHVYAEFADWLKDRYTEYGKTMTYFR